MSEPKNKTTSEKTPINNTDDWDVTKKHKAAPPGPQNNSVSATKATQPPKPSLSASKLPAPPPMLGAKPAPAASKASEAKPAVAPAPERKDSATEIRSLTSLQGAFELKQGLELGEYSLLEPIAQSAMGEVWKARNTKIGKWAAIKVPSHEIAARKESAERFLQEARAVNEIRHRNIVDIFDFGTLLDGRPYYVMELLDGMALSKYIVQRGPLTFGEIIDIFGAVCQALQAAHDHHIVHRDLKSDNIFLILEKKGPPFIKLLDFGIAKLHGILHDQKEATLPGAVYGTPAYMSPEQCQGAKDVDHLTDIYSLGVVLYEMITGRRPFIEASGNTGMLLVKHITATPLAPSKVVSGRTVSKELDALVLRSLAKKPQDRPQNCDVFYEEFVKIVGVLRFEEKEAIAKAAPIFTAEPKVPGSAVTPNPDPPLEDSPTDAGLIPAALAAPAELKLPAPAKSEAKAELKPEPTKITSAPKAEPAKTEAAKPNAPQASPSQANKAAPPMLPKSSASQEAKAAPVVVPEAPKTETKTEEIKAASDIKTDVKRPDIPEHIDVADDLKPLVVSMPTPPKPEDDSEDDPSLPPNEQGFIPTNIISLRPPPSKSKTPLIAGGAIAVALGAFLLWPSATPDAPKLTPATPATVANIEPTSEPITPPASEPAASASVPAVVAETLPAPQVSFVVSSSPDDAEVLLDGVSLGKTPLDIKVPFSETEALLSIAKEGYETVTLKVTPNYQYKNEVNLDKAKVAKADTDPKPKTNKTNKTNKSSKSDKTDKTDKTNKTNTTTDGLPPNPFATPKKPK